MTINNHPLGRSGLAALGHAEQVTTASTASSKGGRNDGDRDEVSISSLGSSLASHLQDSGVSPAKLSSLSAAITNGTYQVNPTVLAGSILQSSIFARG